jgi:hypothetical protein
MKPFVSQYELACWRNGAEVLGRCSVLAVSNSGAVGSWEVPQFDHIPAVYIGPHGKVAQAASLNAA